MGSFLNVVIHRLPKGLSLLHPPSHCPACGHRLGPWDLIPLFSYLLLRGRCRYCKVSISPRYPLVEGLTGLAFLLGALLYPPSLQAFLVFAFLAFLIALSFIDWDTYELPDGLTYGLLGLGLLGSGLWGFPLGLGASLEGALLAAGALALVAGYGGLLLRGFREGKAEVPVGPHQVHMAALLSGLLGPGVGMALAFLSSGLSARLGKPVVLQDRLTLSLLPLVWLTAPLLGKEGFLALKEALLGAGALALAGGLYWALRPGVGETEEEPIAMGYGDVKLMGALGAWTQGYAFLGLFLGALLGALFGLLFHRRKIPFGPFLALGGALAFFLGPDLWEAYLAYLGL